MIAKFFVLGAIFINDAGEADVALIPCDKRPQRQFSERLAAQLKEFRKLVPTDYHGEYKPEDDECLSIKGYQDTGKVIAGMKSLCNGECEERVRDLKELENCRGFVFGLPEFPEMLLIQRFTKALLLKPGHGYTMFSGTVGSVDEYQFSIGNSLVGVYLDKTKELQFRNVQTIRSTLPKFDETYAPGATSADLDQFFSNSIFEEISAARAKKSDSVHIARLVWLAMSEGVDMVKEFPNIERLDRMLNMGCCQDGQIVFPKDVQRAKILLRMALGDVMEKDGRIFLTNSKKPLDKFK